jgi:hypothetical protein
MPIHDWTRVEADIFHDFHHAWTEEIKRALNNGLLPGDYYALAEQFAAGFGPDVLTLQGRGNDDAPDTPSPPPSGGGVALLLAPPKAQPTAETALDFYRRKQNTIVVRHVSGDRIVAMVEVISPGNKASRHGVRALVDKAVQLLERQVHLLFLDLHPPGPRDPNGVHGLIWDEMAEQEFAAPPDRPLTLVAYGCALTLRAYVEPVAVGGVLPDMPLFLEPGGCVYVPLERTYQAAFAAVPRRWRSVLERPAPP